MLSTQGQCAALGAVAGAFWPGIEALLTRALIGWNVLAWTYLAWVAASLATADDGHMKRSALAQAETVGTVLTVVVAAAVTSLVAVVFELAAAKAAGPSHMLWHVAIAFGTVIGSWLLLPVLFSLTYAAAYYQPEPDFGLDFPGATRAAEPGHTDFLYFSFTIAVTAQTSDVAVTSRRHAQARAVPIGALLRLQHDDPRLQHQRRHELLLTPRA